MTGEQRRRVRWYQLHKDGLVDQHTVGIHGPQVPDGILLEFVVGRQAGRVHVLTAHGDFDQRRVGHGFSIVLGLARHEVGDVNVAAENGERGAFDVAQRRVSRGNAQVVVAD